MVSTFGDRHIVAPVDLGNSFKFARSMRIVSMSKEAVLQFEGATLAPIVPLVLTMMPLEDLLQTLLGVIFQRPSNADMPRHR